jgi:hypothetical protein
MGDDTGLTDEWSNDDIQTWLQAAGLAYQVAKDIVSIAGPGERTEFQRRPEGPAQPAGTKLTIELSDIDDHVSVWLNNEKLAENVRRPMKTDARVQPGKNTLVVKLRNSGKGKCSVRLLVSRPNDAALLKVRLTDVDWHVPWEGVVTRILAYPFEGS